MSAGKILFVEDELSKNVSRLSRLFGRYLSRDERESLTRIENDPLGFGTTNQDIKSLFKDNPFIDVEYSFAGALKTVSERYDDYLLFIVDRNLSSSPSTFSDIQAINPSFPEAIYNQYKEREGDYLLLFLASKGINCYDSFYFMTAYGTGASLINQDIIAMLISFDAFKNSNYIEKGKNDDFLRLRDEIINDFQVLATFRDIFEVFKKGWLDNDTRTQFVAAIKDMDNWQPANINQNALNVRQILESVYDSLAMRTTLIPPEIYQAGGFRTLQRANGDLKMRSIIGYLRDKQEISGIHLSATDLIYSMASEIIHDGPINAHASKYSNHAMVHGLCDAILWFKSKMIEQGCK